MENKELFNVWGGPPSWHLDIFFVVFSLIPFMSIQTIMIYSPVKGPASQCHNTANLKLEEDRRGHIYLANVEVGFLVYNVIENCVL